VTNDDAQQDPDGQSDSPATTGNPGPLAAQLGGESAHSPYAQNVAAAQGVYCHWPVASHFSAVLPSQELLPGTQTPVQLPATQVVPSAHATAASHCPSGPHI
jgi:hypothetical protein